jgi:hypothetical protein
MGFEEAAPCRHAGAPPAAVVESVSRLITDLASKESVLGQYGLTAQEYREALPAAIEGMRGSMSASVGDRRQFLGALFEGMLAEGHIDRLEKPVYGDDTVAGEVFVGARCGVAHAWLPRAADLTHP